MSYNENDGTNTTTIEKPKTNILDLIDERVAENSIHESNEIEREVERFDNSHTATGLQRAYDDIDRASARPQPRINNATKPETIQNPFFGDSEVLHKMRRRSGYNDVVDAPAETPTLEIKSVEKLEAKPQLSTRKKMWIGVSACCCVLLLVLVICNIFSIGALESSIGNTGSDIVRQEAELDGLNGQITNNSGRIPEGMQGANGGASIDITPTNPTDIKPSDNFFDDISEFFSYIFGK